MAGAHLLARSLVGEPAHESSEFRKFAQVAARSYGGRFPAHRPMEGLTDR
jgi:hypothetical protein